MSNLHPVFESIVNSWMQPRVDVLAALRELEQPKRFRVRIETPAGARIIHTEASSARGAIDNIIEQLPDDGPITITI